MNRHKFISYLTSPSELNEASLPSLLDVVDSFPYFQTAQILLAKNFQSTKNIKYHSQLKKAAAYSIDRENLYQLLFQKKLVENIKMVENELKIGSEKEKTQSADSEDHTGVYLDVPTRELGGIEPEPKIKIEASKQEDNWANVKKDIDAYLNKKTEFVEADETNVFLPEKEISKEELPLEEGIKSVDSSSQENDIVALENEIISEAISSGIESNASNLTSTHSLNDWLKLLSKGKEGLKTEEVPVDLTPKSSHDKEASLDVGKKESEPELLLRKSNKLSTDALKPANEILDKFIKEEPKISRPKKTEFFSPVNMARLSAVEDLSFVTETLALVYEKQGNYSKAIAAYENLILKIPEKRTYFAARIKALKGLKDNNK